MPPYYSNMHLMITEHKRKEGILKYAKIAESYRDEGSKSPKKRVILNLGPIKSEKDLQKYQRVLDSMKPGDSFINVNDIKAKSPKEYGITYTTTNLLNEYEIGNVLRDHLSKNKAEFSVYEIVKALIINRLVHPRSELSAYDWICKHYSGGLEVQEQHLYRALDYLITKKEEIEQGLFKTLKKKFRFNTGMTYYDLTSSYVEGACCELAMFGYSRNHRRDRKQIVIGLAMCDGLPIKHEVHKGNTVDKTTLKAMQENLKQSLGIKKTIFLADSGLLTPNNLETLEDEEYEYILGHERRQNKIAEKLLVKEINSQEQQYAQEIHREEIVRNEKKITRRYILCLNKNTRKERLETLEKTKKLLEKKLNELQERYKKSQTTKKRGRKLTRESLMQQASNILGKNKRIYNTEFDNGLKYSINKEKWEYEKQIAGKFLLITNTNTEPNEAMKSYKQLQTVENAFDEIKNFLDIRPIYHWKERRVKAHTFICVLSFLIECIIERFTQQTARKIINELEVIKLIELDIKGTKKEFISELSEETETIFKQLNMPKPVLTSGN